MTTEGIFGIPLAVSAVLRDDLRAVRQRSWSAPAPASCSWISPWASPATPPAGRARCRWSRSSLFGTISGSAVANVMVDGPISIPLMKRTGFQPHFAAGVEASASTGGQIMPPIMGAAAFVMAEFLGVSYAPDRDLGADPGDPLLCRLLRGRAFRGQAPRACSACRAPSCRGWARCCASAGICSFPSRHPGRHVFGLQRADGGAGRHAACFPVAALRRSTRELRHARRTSSRRCVDGARNALPVALACACAGIIIGVVMLSGLGIVFTQFVVGLAQDIAAAGAAADHGRRHRARHGHADDAGLHHHDGAAGARRSSSSA